MTICYTKGDSVYADGKLYWECLEDYYYGYVWFELARDLVGDIDPPPRTNSGSMASGSLEQAGGGHSLTCCKMIPIGGGSLFFCLE